MVIPREPFDKAQGYSHERSRVGLRRDYTPTPQITKAYLLGLLHDATSRKNAYRISTKSKLFAELIQQGIKDLGRKAWIYKEGKDRNLWIIEFSKSLIKDFQVSNKEEKLDYIRGFFDAEGGIAKSENVRFYIYFCQKDLNDLLEVKNYLNLVNIKTGIVHNPSKRIDPNYWRFFVSSKSYRDFAIKIGSLHPEKLKILRMKI
ncbi:hypothetical protein A2715_02405 [Candidatus Woesebacteria bacterium RIFCSPHIGHO2_01_FULL_39_32]|nr:MAG: hypothetical protein A2715_02405 [Candidatus Woesebacteria bacterium RIFCSPHIGHO2_01_FULL_39_32]